MRASHNSVAFHQAQTVNYYQALAPSAPVSLPHRMGSVPELTPHALKREVRHLAATALGSPPLVLTGTSGVGKSQLAATFAESAWKRGDLRLLLWVDARSSEAIRIAYARAAHELYGHVYPDPADGARAFFNWLLPAGGTEPRHWLVVLDGVTDPADLDGLWPPGSPDGRVLITSHRRDFTGTSNPVVVPVRGFTREEIRGYLQRALRHRPLGAPDEDEIARRIQRAGSAARFVESAADEIARTGIPLDTYLDALAGGTPYDPSSAAKPVWQSVEAADRTAPEGLALSVLQLVAEFGATAVPEQVLLSDTGRQVLAELRLFACPETDGQAVTADEVRATLRVLEGRNLLDSDRVGTFRTVQAEARVLQAIRAVRGDGSDPDLARGAADALVAAWPEVEPGRAEMRLLQDCADALLFSASSALRRHDGIHPLLFRTGNSAGSWGELVDAEGYFRHAVHGLGDGLGDDHPDVPKARAQAARWRGARGDDFGAAAELAELLPAQEAALGAQHPDVLTTRHHLAWCRLNATSWDAREPLAALAEVLGDRVGVLGPDHPDTLATVSTLVAAMINSRNGVSAGPEVMEVATRLFGFENALRDRDFDGVRFAEALHKEMRRVLGPGHPDTLLAQRALASAHILADDLATAATVLTAAVDEAERSIGPDHPVTLRCRVLAVLVEDALGAEASQTYEELDDLATTQCRILGADHPHSLETGEALLPYISDDELRLEVPELLGDLAGVQAQTEEVFGTDHRRTRGLLRHIADAQARVGATVAAMMTLSDLVARGTRVVGAAHRDTLRDRSTLARLRGEAGDVVGALIDLAAVLSDQQRALGGDHEDVLTTRHHLAVFRGLAGDPDGAHADLTRLLADRERVSGPDDPATEQAREVAEHWRTEAEEAAG
ncbi:tetratricopeptide repeat protein [Actinacidiphila epipremni]|uniref:NACHT domain-containing protein n=1 Tax=Actinacidiphila epipremni TaxID=2053013 RepID=A0ABX0ZJA3_9ACTN|nr:tetratricopeptide repeat protein [Actinacidiphila epipremni]NJP43371.1 hypothetical protein [Actinacidiphila epipremni]